MRYILSTGALARKYDFNEEYKKRTQIDLKNPPTPIQLPYLLGGFKVDLGLPTSLGGKNIKARTVQISFFDKFRALLIHKLIQNDEIKTTKQSPSGLTASRVICGVGLYEQSQMSSNSTFYKLIDDFLGVTETNYFDEEDKQICFLAAYRFIKTANAFEDAGVVLTEVGLEQFSEIEWNNFANFLSKYANNQVPETSYSYYPISSVTGPLFETAGSYTGATIGFLGGDVISQSTKLIPVKLQVTLGVSSLLLLGPSGPMGVSLFSQVIASKLITTFCQFSMAHILATLMGLAGKCVGIGVGLPLDMAYILLSKACAIIGNYNATANCTTGIRICDGKAIIGGCVLEPATLSTDATDTPMNVIEIREDRLLYINNAQIEVPDSATLPPELLEELKVLVVSMNSTEESRCDSMVLN